MGGRGRGVEFPSSQKGGKKGQKGRVCEEGEEGVDSRLTKSDILGCRNKTERVLNVSS